MPVRSTWVCDGQSGNGTSFSTSISVSPLHYYPPIDAPYLLLSHSLATEKLLNYTAKHD